MFVAGTGSLMAVFALVCHSDRLAGTIVAGQLMGVEVSFEWILQARIFSRRCEMLEFAAVSSSRQGAFPSESRTSGHSRSSP